MYFSIRHNGIDTHSVSLSLYAFHSVIDTATVSRGYSLSSPTASVNNTSTTDRQEEMRAVRAQQQDIANQRAVVAAKQKHEKQQQERARKNSVAQASTAAAGAGSRLGGEGSKGDGFNPMQPWTGSTGGYRYVS
jgi:hypothetical protein